MEQGLNAIYRFCGSHLQQGGVHHFSLVAATPHDDQQNEQHQYKPEFVETVEDSTHCCIPPPPVNSISMLCREEKTGIDRYHINRNPFFGSVVRVYRPLIVIHPDPIMLLNIALLLGRCFSNSATNVSLSHCDFPAL
jgi:hypothetical protein